jgi:hypothetical protein
VKDLDEQVIVASCASLMTETTELNSHPHTPSANRPITSSGRSMASSRPLTSAGGRKDSNNNSNKENQEKPKPKSLNTPAVAVKTPKRLQKGSFFGFLFGSFFCFCSPLCRSFCLLFPSSYC